MDSPHLPRAIVASAFTAMLGLASLMPEWVLAEVVSKIPRVGIVFNSAPLDELRGSGNSNAQAFRKGMEELGWIPGRNVEFLWRSAEGDYSRFPGILRELVETPVDVLVVSGPVLAKQAHAATKTIPIVVAGSMDPVGVGLAASLGRPGMNVTGMHVSGEGMLSRKRLAILRDIVPAASHIAYLQERALMEKQGMTQGTPGTDRLYQELGVTLTHYSVDSLHEIDLALADAKRKGVQAVYFTENNLFLDKRGKLATLCEKYRLPAMFSQLAIVADGGLAAYGYDLSALYRRTAGFVDRILRGVKPADLPIEGVPRFYLHINLKAANAIGLTIPPAALMQADRVIE